MAERHFESSWSIDPAQWSVAHDEELAAIAAGRGYTDTDLEPTTIGDFRGLMVGHAEDDLDSCLWWPASSALHLFVTYHGAPGSVARNGSAIAALLETLRVRGARDE